MSDIRRFLCKRKKTENEHTDAKDCPSTSTQTTQQSTSKTELITQRGPLSSVNIYDVGLYLGPNVPISDEIRFKVLKEPWTPLQDYDFKQDVLNEKRAFRFVWLTAYPWLVYSAQAKGPLCRSCVLFPAQIHRGSTQGPFIVRPCTKYQKFHEYAKSHTNSQWHRESVIRSNNFLEIMERKKLDVHEQIDSGFHREVAENRKKLQPIISSILFCAQHDLPLRGKTDDGSVFKDLLHFRVEAGDTVLKDHFTSGSKNALYVSHQVQNEIIEICADVLRETITDEAKKAVYFSILADETADISGTEQLSIGIRYLKFDQENHNYVIHEEFLGFRPLENLDAASISEVILNFLKLCGLDLNKMVGQGYDGCSTMAGHVAGVQKRINDEYPKAKYFHCASHILNLVVNDLNNLSEIRNTAGTIKETITFFRESTLRRRKIPNIPLFCETRWSAKYKSIRIFAQSFTRIVEALKDLAESEAANSKTKVRAYQLYTAVTTPNFVVALHIIATYSAKLEPVCNQLQQVDLDINSVNDHICKLTNIIEDHRQNASEEFTAIFDKAKQICEELNIEIKCPRTTKRQTHRSNHPSENAEEFYRRSVYIPYLDSVISSLKDRFSETHKKSFSLLQLHPKSIKGLSKEEFLRAARDIENLYGDFLPNFISEVTTWFEMWKYPQSSANSDGDGRYEQHLLDYINHAKDFFPSVAEAIKIGLTLPVTTCTIERSFSTLRRVKTWNRSTTGDERLSGLCLLSVHRGRISKDNKDNFMENVINKFGQKPRRLQLLFK